MCRGTTSSGLCPAGTSRSCRFHLRGAGIRGPADKRGEEQRLNCSLILLPWKILKFTLDCGRVRDSPQENSLQTIRGGPTEELLCWAISRGFKTLFSDLFREQAEQLGDFVAAHFA